MGPCTDFLNSFCLIVKHFKLLKNSFWRFENFFWLFWEIDLPNLEMHSNSCIVCTFSAFLNSHASLATFSILFQKDVARKPKSSEMHKKCMQMHRFDVKFKMHQTFLRSFSKFFFLLQFVFEQSFFNFSKVFSCFCYFLKIRAGSQKMMENRQNHNFRRRLTN